MNNKHRAKKKLSQQSSPLTARKDLLATSSCKDDIIWGLYKECLKIHGDKNTKNIKLYLQDVDFFIPISYKQDALNLLKAKNIIEDYKIETEEQKFPPIISEEYSEPYIGNLPFISAEELKKVSKDHQVLDYSQVDYIANVKCNPQIIIKQLKKEFERINQKRLAITKRQAVEKFFKIEQVLKCGKLRFGLETGNAIYEETTTNFITNGQEYLLLKVLMEKPNHPLGYEEINNAIQLKTKNLNPSKKDRRDISFILRNIKRKLEMIGPKRKNKDLFQAHNGYMIVCN